MECHAGQFLNLYTVGFVYHSLSFLNALVMTLIHPFHISLLWVVSTKVESLTLISFELVGMTLEKMCTTAASAFTLAIGGGFLVVAS